jgi:hypothetical protein
LFCPLGEVGIAGVLEMVGIDGKPDGPINFEWSDNADRLREARPNSPHTTQVDVALTARSTSGAHAVVLIEVKFTETDFGWCSAYENPANPARDVCRSAGLFGGQPERCFQLANHGHGRREYDRRLASTAVVHPVACDDDGGCLVRRGRNQPMRNLALAQVLLDEGEADEVVYALCAPVAHPTIWRRFDEVRSVFPNTSARRTVALHAEDIASLHPDDGVEFAAMYGGEMFGWSHGPTDS